MSWHGERLQELLRAGVSYEDAERTIRKEETAAKQLKLHERNQRAKQDRKAKAPE